MPRGRNEDDPVNGRPGGLSPWPLIRRDYSIRFRWHVPSTKQALNDAVEEVLRVARRGGCVGARRADLEISLREALANAIIHGNGLHESKRVFVRCYAVPKRAILIVVRDEGEGFDPEQVPDPRDEDRMHLNHGRGLLLMRELMDHVEYRKNGREVLLFKSYRPTAGSRKRE